VRAEMLGQLIDEKLTEQEIRRYNIGVSEKEIDDAIERIKAMNYFTDEELRMALANEGISMEEYRKGIKTQMLRTNLVNYRIKSKIVITEQDVKTYYNEHLDEYAGETKYHLRNIIMKISDYADEAEKMAVQAKMEMVLDKLKAGEAFVTMAAIYSESSLAEKGGDLGLFRLEDVSPQLQEALKDLAPKDYTPVLDTDQGYQIFYVQEIVQSKGKTLEDVRQEIETKLFNKIVEQKFQTWLEELRGESHIRIFE
jgi:peptidyl-prolyl cis-trans isomerase SurA